MKKKYVDVICLHNQKGQLKPISVLWKQGMTLNILKVKEISPRASLKLGQNDIRYTCEFENHQVRHLYLQDNKWYVEMYDPEV